MVGSTHFSIFQPWNNKFGNTSNICSSTITSNFIFLSWQCHFQTLRQYIKFLYQCISGKLCIDCALLRVDCARLCIAAHRLCTTVHCCASTVHDCALLRIDCASTVHCCTSTVHRLCILPDCARLHSSESYKNPPVFEVERAEKKPENKASINQSIRGSEKNIISNIPPPTTSPTSQPLPSYHKCK